MEILAKEAIHDKTIYKQMGGTCYAHAIASAIIAL